MAGLRDFGGLSGFKLKGEMAEQTAEQCSSPSIKNLGSSSSRCKGLDKRERRYLLTTPPSFLRRFVMFSKINSEFWGKCLLEIGN